MELTNPLEAATSEAIRVIEAFGGTAAVSRLCHIKPPSVTNWKKTGIPAARRDFLRVLRPGLFNGSNKKSGTPQH